MMNTTTVHKYVFSKYNALFIFLTSLHIMQLPVITVNGQQLVVRATFYDTSLMQHTNLIGISDGRKPVGNGYGGTRLHQSFQRILHQSFALSIEGRGSLIEYQDGWVLQDGTGYADALPLTSGESAATVTDVGLELLFRCHDEVVGIGNLRCLGNLLVSSIIAGRECQGP